jgi:hypothetical protein
MAAATAASVSARADTGATGVWIDHTGRGAVEIPTAAAPRPRRSAQDAANNEGCGLQIIGNAPMGDGTWDGGWIYDPDNDAVRRGDRADGSNLKVVG